MFSGKQIPAVGVSIGIERVFAILEEKLKKDSTVRPIETQIYIGQFGKGLINERLRLCAELWQIGVKVETSYKDNPNTQRQLEYVLENGIPLVLWIGESELQQGVVKLKNLNKNEEFFIKREEL